MPSPTCASEVLSGALAFWGQGGERWAHGRLDDGVTACLYGGLGRATYGMGSCGPTQNQIHSERDKAFLSAKTYILDELEARGFPQDIVKFNDHTTYTEAHKSGDVHWRDTRAFDAKRFSLVRDVVCCALKRALTAEEAAAAKVEKP